MADKLQIGSVFPTLTLQKVGGGTVTVPDDLAGNFKVILFYRGHW